MATTEEWEQYHRDRQAWEGWGLDDPDSPRAHGEPEPTPPRLQANEDAEREYRRGGKGAPAGMRRRAREQAEQARAEHDAEPAAAPSSSPRRSAPSVPTPSWMPDGGDAAGALVALVAFALFRAYLANGPAGVKGWFAAKFLNKPYKPATVAPTRPTAPTSPTAVGASR